MSAAHTPGPWHAVDKDGYVESDDPKVHVTSSLHHVALCDSEGDACLIAAAPDLAEALQACVAAFDARIMREGLEGRTPAEARASERARAALAKAGVL